MRGKVQEKGDAFFGRIVLVEVVEPILLSKALTSEGAHKGSCKGSKCNNSKGQACSMTRVLEPLQQLGLLQFWYSAMIFEMYFANGVMQYLLECMALN